MQLAGGLIEYLVAGISGFLWLYPLVNKIAGVTLTVNEGVAILLLPLAYILGVYIDSSSSFIIRVLNLRAKRIPDRLQRILVKFTGSPYDETYARTTRILAKSHELLAMTMMACVSRDRIARCSTLNLLIGFFVSLLVNPSNRGLHILLLIALLWSFTTWLRLVRLSSKFKEQALDAISKQ